LKHRKNLTTFQQSNRGSNGPNFCISIDNNFIIQDESDMSLRQLEKTSYLKNVKALKKLFNKNDNKANSKKLL